jgi:rhodanese-related sulfurtransferase
MGHLLILFVTAASLLLGACGSDVEESADTPISAVEESADTPISAVEESAGTPISAVEESAGTPISAAELADRIRAGSPPLVLDVRPGPDYARGHIPGALNIPSNELPTRLAELPIAKSEEVVVVQESSGRRAALAAETLRGSGYSNIRNLAGHWRWWKHAGLPTE